VLWGINGYLQATGWPLVVQTMSNWFRVGRRGTMMAFISTSYQVGNVLAWIIAGFLVDSWGWEAAFYVPAMWVLPVGVLVLFLMRNQPEDAGLPHIRDDLGGGSDSSEGKDGGVDEVWTIGRIVRSTLTNKMIWNLALSYFCFNAVRYTFMNWAPQYFNQFHGVAIKGSAFLSVFFPLIGSLGAISSGWISDRFFDSRRAPVCTVFLVILAGMCLAFIPVEAGDVLLATVVLAVAGFVIYGADATLTGAAAVDLSHPKAAASAAGFIMAMGNFGSMFVSGAGVGELLTHFKGDWTLVFALLSGLSVVAAALAALLWNKKPKK
jgi:OPA family glycerol-3-phosphate transporter-like MFS transporter